ncbi:hypothetical protein [Pseudomonas anguilliseptica]|uniref:Uncharacterized protein n=1 Tax=Pseudomonas anguilliseptica TaxID=53406 RepID=A0A1H5E0N2_PSEAG|nr:hypothetical protein [Pseudomonas anguilliseptica]SED84747.1 hypothetical protein SAMN05421553_3468 [Pseudomonas anguilliseptica]
MEARFYLLLSDLDAALLAEVMHSLSAEKAVFVEEVAAEWQALYLALEYIELPSSIIPLEPDKLVLGWDTNFDHEELSALAQPFSEANLQVALLLLVLEDGSSMRVLSLDPEAWEDYSALSSLSASLLSESAVTEWLQAAVISG